MQKGVNNTNVNNENNNSSDKNGAIVSKNAPSSSSN
jgi:hypothetical protein